MGFVRMVLGFFRFGTGFSAGIVIGYYLFTYFQPTDVKMNSLRSLLRICHQLPDKDGTLWAYEASRFNATTPLRKLVAEVGCEPILHMRHFQATKRLPEKLVHQVLKQSSDGFPVAKDFNRIVCTCFNGASNIAQAGVLACLSSEGLKAMKDVIGFYKENTEIIVDTFNSLGFNVYGGKNAPHVWVHFPGRSSWDVFAEILEKTHLVTTPGSGFGPGGEGFIKVSAFGHRGNVLEACQRLKQLYK